MGVKSHLRHHFLLYMALSEQVPSAIHNEKSLAFARLSNFGWKMKLTSLRSSFPPLAVGALPNSLARSCFTTSFVFISLLSTNKFAYRSATKTKRCRILDISLLRCSGGRWCFYTISKNLSTSIYRPFCPLFLPIWSHIGLSKKMPYICKGNRNF